MKTRYIVGALLFIISGIAVACGGESSDATPTELIAGEGSKEWRLKREPGLENRATPLEKKEAMVFDTNYTFVSTSLSETRSGHWNYDGTNLTLQYHDNGEMRVFEMLELKENKMHWKDVAEAEFVLTSD